MRAGREVHCAVIGAYTLWQRHWWKGSAGALPALFGAPAENLPMSVPRGARHSGRGARAPQEIVVNRFFDLPHRGAAVLGKTIECAEFGQRAQFGFRK